MKENKTFTIQEIQSKLEYYCTYQERCYKEVEQKLNTYFLIPEAKNQILIYLIKNNFVNEERFAKSYARGKHNFKKWGKRKIIQELKSRDISKKNIEMALKEIDSETYYLNFNHLAEKYWNSLTDAKGQKRNKKWVDFLMRKGYENDLIFKKLHELSKL